MKSILACALFALSFLSAACGSPARTEPHREPFFRSAGFDDDSRIRSLTRLLNYAQSKLKITTYDFEYGIPDGRKLEATFVAEMNGEVVSDMSGTWHIPGADEGEDGVGAISIFYFDPTQFGQTAEPAVWELHIQSPSGSSHDYTANSPFTPPKGGGYGTSVATKGLSSLEEDREVKVWDYHLPYKAADGSGGRPFDFKYTLKVKLTKLGEGERLDQITKVDLPVSK